jgi:hypothetical protein
MMASVKTDPDILKKMEMVSGCEGGDGSNQEGLPGLM